MKKADDRDIIEHGVRAKHSADEGFDASEPQSRAIWGFAIASVICLVVVIGALQQYFEKVWNDAVYEKVLAPPSEQLIDVRGRDDWDLTHYMYLDKKSGQVRIPVEEAQKKFFEEQAAGKSLSPGKPLAPKKEDLEGWQGTGEAPPAPDATPAPAAVAENKK